MLPPPRPQEIRNCLSPEGVRVAYAVAGEGPPLITTANWFTHFDLEWQSPVWTHWLRGLAQRFRLIRYDQRGCGLSNRDVNEFSFETWVDDLELVVDSAGRPVPRLKQTLFADSLDVAQHLTLGQKTYLMSEVLGCHDVEKH